MGNFVLSQLVALGLGQKSLVFTRKNLHLHASIVSCGHERQTKASYDWHGLKRGNAPLTLFQYTLRGKGMLSYKGKECEITPGTAMVLHFPFDNRYWLPQGWEPWEFVYVCLNGAEVMRIWGELENRLGPKVAVAENSPVLSCALALIKQVMQDKVTSIFTASALAYQFCMALSQAFFNKSNPADLPAAVERAVEHARHNLREPVSVAAMAAMAGMSRFHFSRIFSASVGISPVEYLEQVRIEEAVRLLKLKTNPVKEIAFMCGFNDPNYFCKAFKKKIGVSPGAFMRSGMY
jgi:AraC family transcriptional regulator